MNVETPIAKPTLAAPPQRLHHFAFVTKDQEENRKFFEDVLGIPLAATWCERAYNSVMAREIDYCHTFYEIGDGGALAFFQYADEDAHEALKALRPEMGTHIALKVGQESYDEIVGRARAAGLAMRETDHGYCQSVYFTSPDGLKVEFTVDPPHAVEIAASQRKSCHADLARWLAGDHTINNTDRHGVTA